MTHLDLRQKYFDFFSGKGHKILPSTSLVPENDPTTLFTGSGMQPLVPYLLGQPHPEGTRLVDIQKCFRSQDIEEVGDNRHHTFFEMMGNWSLGDYFKEEQLTQYWQFLTKELGFDPKKLHVTCFEGSAEAPRDEESAKIWRSLGVQDDHIHFYGVKKNWWSRSGTPEQMPVGEIGGPDSEMFYEFTKIEHDPKFGKNCHPNCDCGRFLEIGNSVFIQYQKQKDGSFKELKQKNVDFGGGLERTLSALNDNPDDFATDLFSPMIELMEEHIEKYTGQENRSLMRVISDHIKSSVFLINDGIVPSNKLQGYQLRRLIRRAMVKIDTLTKGSIDQEKGLTLVLLAYKVFKIYKGVYQFDEEHICKTITDEQNKFAKSLKSGLRELEKNISDNDTGKFAFDLFQTYGFPIEVTEEELKKRGFDLDKKQFEEIFKSHQELSRTAAKGMFKGGLADHSEIITKYHTATHLLQAALRQVLGAHVHQEGSNLTTERLRFDFSHHQKLTAEEIKKVEEIINEQISKGLDRKVETMTFEEAVKSGAMAFFKERYPEKVTVYSFGDPSVNSGQVFSKEICGGPHVENTKSLGKFKIFKEESVSAGIRRIYASLS